MKRNTKVHAIIDERQIMNRLEQADKPLVWKNQIKAEFMPDGKLQCTACLSVAAKHCTVCGANICTFHLSTPDTIGECYNCDTSDRYMTAIEE